MINFHRRGLLHQFIAAGRFIFLPIWYAQLSQTTLLGNGDNLLPVGDRHRLPINVAGDMKTQSIAAFPTGNIQTSGLIAWRKYSVLDLMAGLYQQQQR